MFHAIPEHRCIFVNMEPQLLLYFSPLSIIIWAKHLQRQPWPEPEQQLWCQIGPSKIGYLQYISVFPKTKADKHTVCLKTQTTRGKGNSMANMVLEASFCGSADNKYVGNIKKWMVHAKDIGNIKLQNVLDLLSTIFEK